MRKECADRGLRPLQGCGTQALHLRAASQFSGDEMSKVRTIDTHTHILTQETAALLSKAGAQGPVTITPDDAESAALDVGGTVYRPFPTGGFDIARRLRDMDAAGRRRARAVGHAADLSLQSGAPR